MSFHGHIGSIIWSLSFLTSASDSGQSFADGIYFIIFGWMFDTLVTVCLYHLSADGLLYMRIVIAPVLVKCGHNLFWILNRILGSFFIILS